MICRRFITTQYSSVELLLSSNYINRGHFKLFPMLTTIKLHNLLIPLQFLQLFCVFLQLQQLNPNVTHCHSMSFLNILILGGRHRG